MKGKYKIEYGEWSLQIHQKQYQNDQGTSMYQLKQICEANENTEGYMKNKIMYGGSQVVLKNPPADETDKRCWFDPWVRKIPEGQDNSLQYFCLENPMDRGAWQAIVHMVAKSQTWLKRLTTQVHI